MRTRACRESRRIGVPPRIARTLLFSHWPCQAQNCSTRRHLHRWCSAAVEAARERNRFGRSADFASANPATIICAIQGTLIFILRWDSDQKSRPDGEPGRAFKNRAVKPARSPRAGDEEQSCETFRGYGACTIAQQQGKPLGEHRLRWRRAPRRSL